MRKSGSPLVFLVRGGAQEALMPVYHDEKLDELAIKKCELGARAEIKNHADEVRVTGDMDVIIKTWEEASMSGALRYDFELTLVRIPQALAYFKKPIREVWTLIDGAQPKTKGKVVSRVLAKMIAKRIRDLLEEIKSANDNAMSSYNFRKGNPNFSSASNPIVPPVPFAIDGDLDSIVKLESEFERWSKSGGWGRDRPLRQLRKALLNKPELTDQDVKDGYNMVLAGIIMSE